MKTKSNILIADDIESIRFAIKDFLESEYNIFEAESGLEALKILENHPIDFIISDIRMPGMGGLELIQHVRKKYPNTQYALMTAYNVNDFIEYAREENIWNIIPKSSNLDLRFIKVMIEKILSSDIFGIEKYFPEIQKNSLTFENLIDKKFNLAKNTLYSLPAMDIKRCDIACDTIGDVMIRAECPSVIRQVIDELVSNALGHPAEKKIDVHNSVEISFGKTGNKYAISILDHHGLLDREEIIYRIERHVKLDKNGLPIGISDSHGRGLFISRENLDHLIFNIDKNKKTEVIGIISKDANSKNKSLTIYQIESAGLERN